jgi:uncharacterized protein involved in exopolysaccharide biosynthesis
MREEAQETFSITSIEFIFRHPWIFICSVVVIMSLIHAKVSLDPVEYESKAVLSFEMGEDAASDRAAERKLTSIKKNLFSKALLGESIRGIIKEVWPDISEKKEPNKYNKLLERLRSPKSGIQKVSDKKTLPNLLELSFMHEDPEVCYKVLQATIDAIKRENKKAVEEKIDARLDFLKNQLKFYRNKLNTINKEMADIKNELVERFPELTERERDLITAIGSKGEKELAKRGSLETYVMYDEMLTNLNLELLEAQKKKESLEKHLKNGTAIPRLKRVKRTDDKDIFLGEYSKAIASKELEIANLIASGYTRNHPQVTKIQNEINRFRELMDERIRKLESEAPEGLTEDTSAKEKIMADIEETEFQIDAIKSKINLINEYKKQSEEQLKPRGDKESDVYERVEKLKELEKEGEINERYYLDIRKQLEEAELKARLEKEEAGFKIDVIEEPSVPLNPITYQKVKLLMLGLIISLMVGSGLAYFVDSLDNSVRSAKELRELFNVPVLASIDKMNTAKEIIMRRARRNTIIIVLFIFVVLSKILVKLFSVIF